MVYLYFPMAVCFSLLLHLDLYCKDKFFLGFNRLMFLHTFLHTYPASYLATACRRGLLIAEILPSYKMPLLQPACIAFIVASSRLLSNLKARGIFAYLFLLVMNWATSLQFNPGNEQIQKLLLSSSLSLMLILKR